jgi:hypothetical protein
MVIGNSSANLLNYHFNFFETAVKEVQDTSCRGSGGVPQLKKPPKIGGYRGLIEGISIVSDDD